MKVGGRDAAHRKGLAAKESSGTRLEMTMKQLKVIVERNVDGYVAYPLGLKGVVVGQGDTYDEVLADVTSAIRFHMETFGDELLSADPPVLDAYVAEARIGE